MFFRSNCLDTNKIIDSKNDDLLTISSQTFHRASYSIGIELFDFVESNNALAQLFSIQLSQISMSIRSLKS